MYKSDYVEYIDKDIILLTMSTKKRKEQHDQRKRQNKKEQLKKFPSYYFYCETCDKVYTKKSKYKHLKTDLHLCNLDK